MKATLLLLFACLVFPAGAARADLATAMAALEQQDFATAHAELLSLAEAGDAQAQFYLAELYWRGNGVAKDDFQAVRWYRPAAEQGLADAQFSLGYMYHWGAGVDLNLASAAYWYGLAADQGDPYARVNLAGLYHRHYVEAPDPGAALRLYRQAASTLRERAARADVTAQVMLGSMYKGGLGMDIDLQVAATLFRAAADAGVAVAQYEVAELFRPRPPELEKYVKDLPPPSPLPQSAIESYKWYALATRYGDPLAASERDHMASKLTAEELATANAWLDAWQPRPARPILIEE
jgi:hypothetical protein